MSDNDIEISRQGWLNRLAGSFLAALFGILLFLASFVLLYWNEERAGAGLIVLGLVLAVILHRLMPRRAKAALESEERA